MVRDHRLASIAIMLASGERLRAADLAGCFAVSERTVYRDMQHLAERGFPLAAIPGPNGGFAMFAAAGNRNVSLELDEALALAVGAAMVRRALVCRGDDGAAYRALGKVQTIMPESVSTALPDLLALFCQPRGNGQAGGERRRPR
jgi:predicted DNA-binding transcriptional regulator YafY